MKTQKDTEKLIYKNFFRRSVTVINNIPFYKSSGYNSRNSDTWFPTLGHSNGEMWYEKKFEKPGEIFKILTYPERFGDSFLKDELRPESKKALDDILDAEIDSGMIGNTLKIRFGSLCCLLISSKLGGGFWDTPKGKTVLGTLLKESSTCRKFYEGLPDFVVESHLDDEELLSPSDIPKCNAWINTLIAEKRPDYPYKNSRDYKDLSEDELNVRFPRSFDDYQRNLSLSNFSSRGDNVFEVDYDKKPKTVEDIEIYKHNLSLYQSKLMHAVASNEHAIVQTLLALHPEKNWNFQPKDPRAKNNVYSILYDAALYSDPEMLGIILSKMKGKNVDTPLDDGATPLLAAVNAGRLENIVFLLEQGANINHQNKNGHNALHFAIARGHPHVIDFILRHTDIDINATDKNGLTALHQAAYRGDMELVDRLVEKGANVNVTDHHGKTPMMIAQEHHSDNDKLLQLLTSFNPVDVLSSIYRTGNNLLSCSIYAKNEQVCIKWKGDSVYSDYAWEGTPNELKILEDYEVVLSHVLQEMNQKKSFQAIKPASYFNPSQIEIFEQCCKELGYLNTLHQSGLFILSSEITRTTDHKIRIGKAHPMTEELFQRLKSLEEFVTYYKAKFSLAEEKDFETDFVLVEAPTFNLREALSNEIIKIQNACNEYIENKGETTITRGMRWLSWGAASTLPDDVLKTCASYLELLKPVSGGDIDISQAKEISEEFISTVREHQKRHPISNFIKPLNNLIQGLEASIRQYDSSEKPRFI